MSDDKKHTEIDPVEQPELRETSEQPEAAEQADTDAKTVSQEEVENIIEAVKADETPVSTEIETEQSLEPKKKKSPKLNKLYRGDFSEQALNRKIYKRIFIPVDRTFVEGFFVARTETVKNKERTRYRFTDKPLERKDIVRLNRIAKDIKRQKGRVNFIPLLAAVAAIILVLFFVYLFRNTLSRKIIVSSSEAAFGAKCDIGYIDFNLFDTHFQIKDYAVANKNAPMKNLFEIKNIDLYFNLLELSRGKFVCENIAIDGITWNTDRKTSGALPVKAKKKDDDKPTDNPIMKMVNEELDKIKTGVSVSNGLEAVRQMTDPRLIIEREAAAFQTPKMATEIMEFTPAFINKWEKTINETENDVRTLVAKGQDFANMDFQSIDSIEEIQQLVEKMIDLSQASKKAVEKAKNLSHKIQSDAENAANMAKNAVHAFEADINHVKDIAANIQEFKAKGVGGFVSELFKVFYLQTLGSYYPRVMELIGMINNMQSTPKVQKKPTLADKSKKLERLPGRNFLFSSHSNPTLLFKNIQLSAHTPERNFTITGDVQNITNDADRLNKPITLHLASTQQQQFAEHIKGIIDVRHSTPQLVAVTGDFSGLNVDLDAQITGLPTLAGMFSTDLTVEVGKNKDLRIVTSGRVNNARLQIAEFEPAMLSRIYGEVLARIDTVDLTTELFKAPDQMPQLKIDTSVDEQIFASVKEQLKIEMLRIRDQVIAEGKKYLEKLRAEYLPQLDNTSELIDAVKLAVTDSRAFELMIQKKLKEAEARVKQLAKNKVNEVKDKAVDQLKDTIKDSLKDNLPFPFP